MCTNFIAKLLCINFIHIVHSSQVQKKKYHNNQPLYIYNIHKKEKWIFYTSHLKINLYNKIMRWSLVMIYEDNNTLNYYNPVSIQILIEMWFNFMWKCYYFKTLSKIICSVCIPSQLNFHIPSKINWHSKILISFHVNNPPWLSYEHVRLFFHHCQIYLPKES